MKSEEEIKAEIVRCWKEYKKLHTPPISLNSEGGLTHYKRGKALLWVLGLRSYKDIIDEEFYSGMIMADKQTLKVIKNPVKKAMCILAMRYWRWLQKKIGVNNDR